MGKNNLSKVKLSFGLILACLISISFVLAYDSGNRQIENDIYEKPATNCDYSWVSIINNKCCNIAGGSNLWCDVDDVGTNEEWYKIRTPGLPGNMLCRLRLRLHYSPASSNENNEDMRIDVLNSGASYYLPDQGHDIREVTTNKLLFMAGQNIIKFSALTDQSVWIDWYRIYDCTWVECTPGETQGQSCGNCGTRTRVCQSNYQWGSWSGCTGQGVCSSGSTQPCGNCGTQTCQSNCQWGSCTGQGCSPGSTDSKLCGSGECIGTQTRSCSSSCQWSKWSDCSTKGDDCGICALCDEDGKCTVYDGTQDEDCSDTICPDDCDLSPDDKPYTLDYALDVENECVAIFTCSNNPCDYWHKCSVDYCGAECDSDDDCSDCNPNTIDTCNLDTCMCEHEYLPYCGDGNVGPGEECEPPFPEIGYGDNPFCSQTLSECLGNKRGTRDAFGDCNAECGCIGDPFTYQCVKDECGAECDSDDDCSDCNPNTIDTCNLDTCMCEHTPTTECGNGIIDPEEQCELPSTTNNPFCPQTTTDCSGNKLGTRDAFGDCNAECGCIGDPFTYQCVKDECGAECDSNDDCECPEDSCIDADLDGYEDDYANYPEHGVCLADCSCDISEEPCSSPCKPTISYNDERCGGDDECLTDDDCSYLTDQCNNGICNENYLCEKVPKTDGIVCDDGFFCTVNDFCLEGSCVGYARDCSDGIDCTDDSCDEANDKCVNTACIEKKEGAIRKLLIKHITFVNEDYVYAGDYLITSVILYNNGNKDLDELKITVSIPELGIHKSTKRFDLRENRELGKTILLPIPYYVEPGVYDVRIVVSNDEIRRVRTRQIIILA